MSFHFSNLPLYSSVCRSQTPPPSSAPTSPPTISLIGSRYYPHRISADDLFCTYTPDLSTDFFAIILTHQNPRSIQQNSPVLTPSPSTDSPDSPLRSQSRDSSSSGSSVSARSTTSFGLDYLHEDPYQDFDVDVERCRWQRGRTRGGGRSRAPGRCRPWHS